MKLFILDMWHIFANEYERRKYTLQTGTLYERFMQLAQEHCLTERDVQFYSNQLNITSKYLNQICKSSSGVTASEWIQRFTKERIIILLQNKNLNISEIANEMEFSSRSFFTRYVKNCWVQHQVNTEADWARKETVAIGECNLNCVILNLYKSFQSS